MIGIAIFADDFNPIFFKKWQFRCCFQGMVLFHWEIEQ